MAYVEENLVVGSGKDSMQCKRKLDDAEIGAEMAAGLGERLNKKAADFFRERDHLVSIQLFQVGGRMNGLQQGSHVLPSPGGVRESRENKPYMAKRPLETGGSGKARWPLNSQYTFEAIRRFAGLDARKRTKIRVDWTGHREGADNIL
jgi:hypothetical protein